MELFRELRTYPTLDDWTFDSIFFHVRNILTRIQKESRSSSIESYFVKGCQLMPLEDFTNKSFVTGLHIEHVFEHLARFEALMTLPKL